MVPKLLLVLAIASPQVDLNSISMPSILYYSNELAIELAHGKEVAKPGLMLYVYA